MRRTLHYVIVLGVIMGMALEVGAATLPSSQGQAPSSQSGTSSKSATSSKSGASDNNASKPVEVTADQSLEWYQDQNMYVARGKAKAVKGEMVVEADVLAAHEREVPKGPDGKKLPVVKPPTTSQNSDAGDIDRMTADGHVRVTDPRERVLGDHAVYDLDLHFMVMTGNNLRYETEKDIVTARDSLEYWEDKKVAVARGHAVGIRDDRHLEGDVLTAEFRDNQAGQNELSKMTGEGHVIVITKSDVSRGDHMVFDASRNIAILTSNVHITRADGTQLTGDVGEVDFTNNKSRLLNEGHGRVRALLNSKATPASTEKPVKATDSKTVTSGTHP